MSRSRWRSRAALAAIVVLSVLSATASTRVSSDPSACTACSLVSPEFRGRLIILPGIRNTKFHLSDFARASNRLLPGFSVEVLRWGVPLLGLYNLSAVERNERTAEEIAADIASWRRTHRDEKLYLIGYSGGGGVAALVLRALPDDVSVDRLILVAPAISRSRAIETTLLRHVDEFVVNYASDRDLQVGLGTRIFGTIDRKREASAGHDGFEKSDPRIVEWRWQPRDRRLGHNGNHLGYLGRRWQMAHLLPALDPGNDAEALRARWLAARSGDTLDELNDR